MTTAGHEDSSQTTQVSQLCRTLAIVTLRHEDALNSLACQDQFILFLTQGPQGMSPLLIQTAQDWREQSNVTSPLRVVLMQTLLEELMRRFKGFCTKLSDEDFRRQSIQTKVILEDNTVPYLQWNHQQKCLLPSQVQGMSIQDMEQRLQRLHSALQEPSNLIRFFALRSQGQTTGVTPWKIQLSMRNDALMCEMKHLLGSAIWMLIAGRLRAHSQQRSRAAQELQEIAYPRKPGNRRH